MKRTVQIHGCSGALCVPSPVVEHFASRPSSGSYSAPYETRTGIHRLGIRRGRGDDQSRPTDAQRGRRAVRAPVCACRAGHEHRQGHHGRRDRDFRRRLRVDPGGQRNRPLYGQCRCGRCRSRPRPTVRPRRARPCHATPLERGWDRELVRRLLAGIPQRVLGRSSKPKKTSA